MKLGLWCALLFGLAEGAWMTWARVGMGKATLTGLHVVWLAPLMDIFWFGLLALLLVAVARLRPSGLSLVAVLRVFLAFGFLSLLLLAWSLARWAALILSLGLAFEASRRIGLAPERFERLVRRSLVPLLATLAVTIGGAFAVQHLDERRALARAAGAQAPAGAPNVLLLIMDTVRDLDLSVSGYHRPTTPNLERFAATGTRFSRAWSPSSWTLSSHASMFTGRRPHRLSAGLSTPLYEGQETIAERLARRGWLTAGFVGNLHYASRHYGLNRGFQHYEDYVLSPAEALVNSSVGRYLVTRRSLRALVGYQDIVARRRATGINAHLLRWVDAQRGRPFFAFVNYYEAHEPYEPPAEFERRFASNVTLHRFVTDQSVRGARRIDKPHMTPAEVSRLRDNYDASIAWLDQSIGQLLDSLRRRGLLENTIVIVTSDHGEQFGEHGLFVHGNSLFQPVMHVPMIVSWPGRIPAGQVVDDRVNLRNLAATISDLTGTAGDQAMPGQSLAPLWQAGRAAAPPRPMLFEVITTSHEILRSVVLGDLQYIRKADGAELLLALPADTVLDAGVVRYGSLSADQPLVRLMGKAMDSILAVSGPDNWGP